MSAVAVLNNIKFIFLTHIRIISLIISCSCAVLISALAILYHFPLPIFDHFILLPLLEQYYAGTLSLSDIFQVRGGHWLASPFLIQIPLAILTGWSQLAEVMVSLLFLFGSTILLILTAYRSAMLANIPHSRPMMLLVISILALAPDQTSNLFWGMMMGSYISILCTALVIYSLTHPLLRLRHHVVAMIAALIGVYSFSSSYAALPIAALLILIHPALSRHKKIFWFTAWVALTLFALWHYASSSPALGLVKAPIWLYPVFMIAFLGSAISRFASDLCIPLSLIIVPVYLYILWLHKRRIPLLSYAPFVAWMLYAVGAAFTVAVGRIEFGLDQAYVARYIVFSNFFWFGASCLVILCLYTQPSEITKTTKNVLVSSLLIILLLKAGNAYQVGYKNIRLNHRYADFKERLLLNNNALTENEVNQMYMRYTSPWRKLPDDITYLRTHRMCGFN